MDRVIEVKVTGSHLTKSSNLAGVQGENKTTTLRIEFDEGWDGYAKTITWLDAKGENRADVVLTLADSGLSKLENIAESTRVYMSLIPPEALAVPGETMFAIDGYMNGKRQKSIYGKLIVRPGDYATLEDATPELAMQIQAQIEAISENIQAAQDRAEEAASAANASKNTAKEQANTAKNEASKALSASDSARLWMNEALSAKTNATNAAKNAELAKTDADEAAKAAKDAEQNILQHIKTYGDVVSDAYVNGDELYIRTNTGKEFSAGNVRGKKGEKGGTTFIPSVSAEGVISWTNDGGVPNPEPVNIKGPKGEPGVVVGGAGSGQYAEIFNNLQSNGASGLCSHAEGYNNDVSGAYSHVEGANNTVSGKQAHGEGSKNKATGDRTHAEGWQNIASGDNAHAEGLCTIASGENSHSAGRDTIASGKNSHSAGRGTIASGENQTVVGQYNKEDLDAFFIVGNGSAGYRGNVFVVKKDGTIVGPKVVGRRQESLDSFGNKLCGEVFNDYAQNIASGDQSHSEGMNNQAIGYVSHAEGKNNVVRGARSHAEGSTNVVYAYDTHVEGRANEATGQTSHVEGGTNKSKGAYVHVEGNQNRGYGHTLHAEGYKTTAFGHGTHSEGASSDLAENHIYTSSDVTTIKSNDEIIVTWKALESGKKFSLVKSQYFTDAADETILDIDRDENDNKRGGGHGEGWDTLSLGLASHAEGRETIAESDYCHASGWGTHAKGVAQTVVGELNEVDENALFIVGNGDAKTNSPSNAFKVMRDGSAITSADTAPTVPKVRNTALVNTATTPSGNGEICWQYS